MATILIEAEHGGSRKVGGSDANHAVGPSRLLEKSIALDIAKRMGKAPVLVTIHSMAKLLLYSWAFPYVNK